MAVRYTDLENVEQIQYDNTGVRPIQVPGFGLPVHFDPVRIGRQRSFRHGAMDWITQRLAAREIAMINLMDSLTEKPDWHKGIFVDKTVKKWRKEAREIKLISRKAWDWCLEELRDKANQFEKTGWVFKCDTASRCIVSDSLVSEDTKHDFLQAVKPLLDQNERDWQPYSNEQVANLVHPSLYPLVYSKTRVLQSGQVHLDDIFRPPQDCIIPAAEPPDLEDEEIICRDEDAWSAGPMDFPRYSWRFQWLPCEVAFSSQTGHEDLTTTSEVQITSYINNLHPVYHDNKKLYSLLSSLIKVSIPLWNEILVKNRYGRRSPRIPVTSVGTKPAAQPKWASLLTKDPNSDNWKAEVERVRQYVARPDNPYRNAKYNDGGEVPKISVDNWEEINGSGGLSQIVIDKFHRLRLIVHPEPGFDFSCADWLAGNLVYVAGTGWLTCPDNMQHLREIFVSNRHNLAGTFRKEGLQVIIKIASIELTPAKPRYSGGDWHVAGMLNEHIIASSVYCFDSSNITQPAIRFRQEARLEGFSYNENDHEPIETVFGVDKLTDEPAIQELGSVATPEGRLLCFPNTLQHKVEPFELLEGTKPGYQRIAVPWLVDPDYRILSTRNVPPQQHEWWVKHAKQSTLMEELPEEVQTMISEEMKEGLTTLEQAKTDRLELMRERAEYIQNAERVMPQYNFF